MESGKRHSPIRRLETQYERVQRWHRRIHAVDWSVDPIPETAFDDVYAFFQNCFALRDGLIATNASLTEETHAAVRSSQALRICRDLCNATKHFNISKPSTSAFTVGRQYRAQPFVVYEDAENGERLIEVRTLADDCMNASECVPNSSRAYLSSIILPICYSSSS